MDSDIQSSGAVFPTPFLLEQHDANNVELRVNLSSQTHKFESKQCQSKQCQFTNKHCFVALIICWILVPVSTNFRNIHELSGQLNSDVAQFQSDGSYSGLLAIQKTGAEYLKVTSSWHPPIASSILGQLVIGSNFVQFKLNINLCQSKKTAANCECPELRKPKS